ncbi:hypothetical protein RJ639_027621 [Escallonia herrerae]|uniref:Reverse transcriptase Ty1/copia-type domain-containing protein n=1 Tax=Escallonia herrerae TaxID=1293975 RepID=A0AA88X3R8_9ASTE|nr:hypothetical protein RJ639_027621 [Escallonia herrerae]
MVDMLGRAGRLHETYELIKEMPSQPNDAPIEPAFASSDSQVPYPSLLVCKQSDNSRQSLPTHSIRPAIKEWCVSIFIDMAKDAETSKPKHLDPTSEYYLSSQANSATAGDPDRTPTGWPWCTFCHRVGHTHEKCYRRLSIAPPGKGRGRGHGSPAMSQNAVGSSSGPLQASAAVTQNNNPSLSQAQDAATFALPGLTPEQMQRLNTFLESSPSGTDSLDIPPSPVGLPAGLQTNAIKAGSVFLADGITLRHVLYVPNLAVNLISVSCLATDANCFVAFSHDICVLQDRTSKSPIGLGKMHRGVFIFQPLSTATVVQPLSTATVPAVSKSESYELWHRRMGHPSSQPLIHLPTVSVVSPSLKTICDVCCRAKHSWTVFPDNTSRAMDIFGLVHCDIWGPYRGQTGTLFRNFCNRVHTQFGKLVKIIRSNNGHEFDSQPMTQFYNDHGKKGWRVYDLETNQVFFSRDVKFEETVFPFTTPLGPSPTPATTTFCPAWDCAEHPMASPLVIGGDTPPMTGGDPPPSLAATLSPGLSGITAGPDPEISSSASPLSFPTALSPTLGRGKQQKKAPSVLKDYSHADHTFFTYRKGDVFLSVLVYVDDLILAGNNSTACFSFKKYLNDCFKLKDLGPLKYFLGIEAARGPRGLFLSQRKYALDILSESGLSASKPAAFPMEQNHGLALTSGPLLSDPGPYR